MLKGKLVNTVSHEERILDLIIYMDLGNTVTSNKIVYKLWSIDKDIKKNHWVHFKVVIKCYYEKN